MSSNKEIPDIQSDPDERQLAVHKVGIKALKHPVIAEDRDLKQNRFACPTVATFNMFVNLAAHHKATHMSRFVEILHEQSPFYLSSERLPGLLDAMLNKLEAKEAFIEANFPFFLEKEAPLSKVKSYLDYDVTLKARIQSNNIETGVFLTVPVTTLCPCSKKISQYGAHNQRSHVMLEAWANEPILITPLIKMIEAQASCELYGTLKRLDEKYVTEKAYENPKFVEDLVRDIALDLNKGFNFSYYRVASENFESIHNHSAYAEIVFP